MNVDERELDKRISDNDDLVWHYTDSVGLLGIVRDHELWAGHLDYMNDTREGSGLRAALQADEQSVEEAESIAEGVLTPQFEQDWDPSIRMPSGSNFIISASRDSDSLAMWRGYGRSAAAFAVGINKKFALQLLVKQEQALGDMRTIRWSPVEYDSAKAGRSEGETAIERIRHRVMSGIDYMEAEADAVLDDQQRATAWLQFALVLYKNPYFEEEQESRLSVLNVPARLWDWRPSARGPVPYIKLTGPASLETRIDGQTLPDDMKDYWDSDRCIPVFDNLASTQDHKLLPIEAIRCAPGSTERDQIAVRQILLVGGYNTEEDYEHHNPESVTDVPVLMSKIPFRW